MEASNSRLPKLPLLLTKSSNCDAIDVTPVSETVGLDQCKAVKFNVAESSDTEVVLPLPAGPFRTSIFYGPVRNKTGSNDVFHWHTHVDPAHSTLHLATCARRQPSSCGLPALQDLQVHIDLPKVGGGAYWNCHLVRHSGRSC